MRKIVITSWITLDGLVAGPDDEMDWVGRFYDEAMGEYETALVRGGDTLLLGRGRTTASPGRGRPSPTGRRSTTASGSMP